MTDIAGKVPSLEAAVDKKERDLQKALLESARVERLLGLVMNKDSRLNPQLVRGICERFIRNTYMQDLFYR